MIKISLFEDFPNNENELRGLFRVTEQKRLCRQTQTLLIPPNQIYKFWQQKESAKCHNLSSVGCPHSLNTRQPLWFKVHPLCWSQLVGKFCLLDIVFQNFYVP